MLYRVSKAFRHALLFGGALAIASLVRVGMWQASGHALPNGTEWYTLPLKTFAIAFPLAFLLIATGGVTPNARNPTAWKRASVNPWFAWLVAGGFVAFWAAAFIVGNLRGGWRGVTIWAFFLAALYVARLFIASGNPARK